MASFRFRNGKWQVQVRLSIGPKITRSFHLKSDAQAWARTTESDIQAGRLKVANCPTTMADILERYSHEVTVYKRSANKEIGRIRRMLRESFAAIKLKDLTPAILNEFKDRRLKEVGAQAVLHDLNLLSYAIKIARMEWGLDLTENPFDLIRKPPQPPSRTRRLKSEELDKLLAAIATRPSRTFQAFVTLAIETGMRRGELLGLHWENIDLQRSEAYLGMTKNGQARMIPLSPLAHTVLKELYANRKSRRVLPITIPTLRYYWLQATKKAGIADFHIHDLRREAISRLFEHGLSIPEVATISGHQDWRMVARYVKFSTSQLVQKLSKLVPANDGEKYFSETPPLSP